MSPETCIHNLLAEYTYAMDDGAWGALEELFAQARFTMGDDDFGGREGMGRFAASLRLHDGLLRTKHLNTNIRLEIDDDGSARARSYWVVLQALEGFPLQPVTAGQYRDEFVRVDGRWRFSGRNVSIDLFGDTRHLL